MNKFISIGAILGLLAVIIGAFGAHGLEGKLDSNALTRYQTGVEYHFYHTGAVLIIGILYQDYKMRLLKLSGLFFIVGTLIFSGSLYAYALTGVKTFGMITPLGGICFILGWVLLFIFSLRSR